MRERMIVREAGAEDFWGLFLLYVPWEKHMAPHGKQLDPVNMTGILERVLEQPAYKFFVVEYKQQIVAAYGLKSDTDTVSDSAPILSDIKIDEGVQGILMMDELVEHAILHGRLAGYNQITCADSQQTLQ